MCLESSTPRTLTGGAVATLHPRLDATTTTSPLDRQTTYQLHLRTDTSSTQPRTIATLISPTFWQAQSASVQRYRVVIQRDGDLTTSTSPSSPPMHSFQFSASAADSDGERSPLLELDLDTAMDLSVGGEGLIGRRVQLVDDGAETGRVLREGVLGWN